MREDMAKVIVERPRRGGGNTRKGRAVPLDDLPFGEGMRRPHVSHYKEKTLNENLAPLRRYLDRQVGRPWRKVYAEISANLRVESTVDQHVRDHVRDFVALKPRLGINDFKHRADGIWHQDFYVEPEDGLLKRTADLPALRRERRIAAQRRPAPRAITRIALAPDRELRQIDGLWFELALERLPDPVYREERETRRAALNPHSRVGSFVEIDVVRRRLVTPPLRDALRGAMVFAGPVEDTAEAWREFRRRNRDRLYVAAKRQLGRRELRRHGLANAIDNEFLHAQRPT